MGTRIASGAAWPSDTCIWHLTAASSEVCFLRLHVTIFYLLQSAPREHRVMVSSEGYEYAFVVMVVQRVAQRIQTNCPVCTGIQKHSSLVIMEGIYSCFARAPIG